MIPLVKIIVFISDFFFLFFLEDKSAINAQISQYAQISQNTDPNGNDELSPLGTNDDSVEGAVPQLNGTNDGDEDDPFSKRRCCSSTCLGYFILVAV